MCLRSSGLTQDRAEEEEQQELPKGQGKALPEEQEQAEEGLGTLSIVRVSAGLHCCHSVFRIITSNLQWFL